MTQKYTFFNITHHLSFFFENFFFMLIYGNVIGLFSVVYKRLFLRLKWCFFIK